jgi:hypothetical protein
VRQSISERILQTSTLLSLRVETGTAPTAGNAVGAVPDQQHRQQQLACQVTGSDGAYTLGTLDANLRQAGPPVATLVATNDGNTVLIQNQSILASSWALCGADCG